MSVKSRVRELRLEPLSARFAEHVISRKPEWERLLGRRSTEIEGLPVQFAQFSFPSENLAIPETLNLFVAEDQTLYIDWFVIYGSRRWDHEFIQQALWMQDPVTRLTWTASEEETFDDAITSVELILSEAHIAFAQFDKEPGSGSYGFTTEDQLAETIEKQRERGGRAMFRSWKGSFDQDLAY